jgi:hypothetical protein
MNLRTGVVKRIVRHHDTAWRTNHGDGFLLVAASSAYPDIAVVYADHDPPIVVTVLWRTQEQYDRATYRPAPDRRASEVSSATRRA